VLIVEICPQQKGKHFFMTNGTYKMVAARHSNASFQTTFINEYADENIPAFWSRVTEKLSD
jgi:hypothetical protein